MIELAEERIRAHHRPAAATWSQGGRAYDEVSSGISDALAHAAQRLNPQAGEAILDVATGTGWTARNIARSGARVTGADIADELLAAARELSAHVRPAIAFELADAERLPFADGQFDGVISTFGVMFAQDQQQAAAELGRVCRRGGRLALATWTPDGAVARFFGVVAKHSDAPAPAASPLAWGDPGRVKELLGRDFELAFERGVSNAYYDGVEDVWRIFAQGFGPVRRLAEGPDPTRRAAFKADVDAYHAQYAGEAGLHIRREYLVAIGRRR